MNNTYISEDFITARYVLTVFDATAIGTDVLVCVFLSLSRISATKSNAILMNSQLADITEGIVRLSTKFMTLSMWASEVALNARVALSSARIFFMALLALNLYFAVVRAADYKKIFGWCLTVGLLATVWALNAAMFGLTTLLSSMQTQDPKAKESVHYGVSVAAIFLVQALPLAVSSAIYWRMVRFRQAMLLQGLVHLADTATTRQVLARAMFRFSVFGGAMALLVFLGRYAFQMVDDASFIRGSKDYLAYASTIHAFQYTLIMGKVYILWNFFPPFRSAIVETIQKFCCYQSRVAPEPDVEAVQTVGRSDGVQNLVPRVAALTMAESGVEEVPIPAKPPPQPVELPAPKNRFTSRFSRNTATKAQNKEKTMKAQMEKNSSSSSSM